MKKKTTVFIIALLFSLLPIMQIVNEGKSNPLQELGSVPPDSKTKPSIVTILSPMNNSMHTTDTLSLSVNVTLPESSTALGTILYFVICQTDWQKNETRLYQNGIDNSIESQIPGDENHYFQGSLSFEKVPAGNHNITIIAVAGGWYPGGYGNCGFYRFRITGSSTVLFTTGIQPTSTPTEEPQQPEQDLTAGAVFAVASIFIFIALLFYFIKRK